MYVYDKYRPERLNGIQFQKLEHLEHGSNGSGGGVAVAALPQPSNNGLVASYHHSLASCVLLRLHSTCTSDISVLPYLSASHVRLCGSIGVLKSAFSDVRQLPTR